MPADVEPVHCWFGLTYSAYLVLPRSLMEGMPEDWQRRMVALLEEMRGTYDDAQICDSYMVRAKSGGKFVADPFSNYRRPPPLPYRKPAPGAPDAR